MPALDCTCCPGTEQRDSPADHRTRCSIPYVHVEDAQAAFDKALREGAEEMLSPTRVMEGVTVAIVRAPGGVPIGFSGA
jgi:uncharacterized protein